MDTDFDIAESNSSSSSSFYCYYEDSALRGVYRGFSIIFIVVFSALCFFPIKFFVTFAKQSIAKRKEDSKGLLPGMESRLVESSEKGMLVSLEGRRRVWSLIFFLFLSVTIVSDIVCQFCYLLASFSLVPKTQIYRTFQLGDNFAFVGAPLGIVSYTIVIAMWWRVFVTLSELRQTYVSSNASVPNMFKKEKHRCLKKSLIPICFTLGALLVIAWVVIVAISFSDLVHNSSCRDYEEIEGAFYKCFPVYLVFFFLFSILYFSFAVALVYLYKMRFYDETARSVVNKVILLCCIIGVCFTLRIVLLIVMTRGSTALLISLQPVYFIIADIIPIVVALWLQAKSLSTASTTTSTSREMWTTALQAEH